MIKSGNVGLLFLVVGVAYWQYGGGLSLLPALTADYYGSKNLGANYGLVFLGWGIAFFVPQLGGYLKDLTGSLDAAFYVSGGNTPGGSVVEPMAETSPGCRGGSEAEVSLVRRGPHSP